MMECGIIPSIINQNEKIYAYSSPSYVAGQNSWLCGPVWISGTLYKSSWPCLFSGYNLKPFDFLPFLQFETFWFLTFAISLWVIHTGLQKSQARNSRDSRSSKCTWKIHLNRKITRHIVIRTKGKDKTTLNRTWKKHDQRKSLYTKYLPEIHRFIIWDRPYAIRQNISSSNQEYKNNINYTLKACCLKSCIGGFWQGRKGKYNC